MRRADRSSSRATARATARFAPRLVIPRRHQGRQRPPNCVHHLGASMLTGVASPAQDLVVPEVDAERLGEGAVADLEWVPLPALEEVQPPGRGANRKAFAAR